MIKGLFISLVLMSVYTFFLKDYLINQDGAKKELAKVIKPNADLLNKHPEDTQLNEDVNVLQQYRVDMLKKVNEINQLIDKKDKMENLKRLLKSNEGIKKIKESLGDSKQFEKIKEFIMNYGLDRIDLLQSKKTLNEKDIKHIEVKEPMTLEEYKEMFNQ